MQPDPWIEQAHALMNLRTALCVSNVALSVAVCLLMHRRGCASRVLSWSAAKFNPHRSERLLSKLPAWLAAAVILLSPVALIGAATQVTRYEAFSHYGVAAGSGGLTGVWHNLVPWAGSSLAAVLPCALLAALDVAIGWPWKGSPTGPTLPDSRERVAEYVALRRLRAKAASSALYRQVLRLAMVCVVLVLMHALAGADLWSGGGRAEPAPDSPRKEAIFSLAKELNLHQVEVNIKDVPGHMNASGGYHDDGALIEFTRAFWDGTSDRQFLSVVGHEFYHMFHGNPVFRLGWYCGIPSMGICFLLFLAVGRPRVRNPARFNVLTRLPIYVILFVVAWPVSGAALCAVKRPEEARADRAGVQYLVGRKLITPEDAREALTLINRNNLHDPDPNWLAWLLFYDHPPLTERLRNIDDAVRSLEVETAKK